MWASAEKVAMWWTYWPTPWMFLAPLMMLACMAGMFFMMRAMHGGHHRPTAAGVWPTGMNLGPHVAARAPERQSAFEEYRAETLRRLDDEQKDFQDFLGRLRTAKDRAEFEQFMADRRTRTSSPA